MKDLKSFTLHPKAGQIVDSWKKGKKSGKVSDAIVKYQKWREWSLSIERGKTPEDMRFYNFDSLQEAFNKKCIENRELKQELYRTRLELVPKRSLINRLFSSNGE